MYTTWLILKARNRFKHREIAQLADLADILYGGWSVTLVAIIHIAACLVYVLSYQTYFGEQVDQLFCTSLELTECGNKHMFGLMMISLQLPLLMIRRMASAGIINSLIMAATLVSLGIVIYYSVLIKETPENEVNKLFMLGLIQTHDELNLWNFSQIPLLFAGMSNLFEGNILVLNIYSETQNPRNFCTIVIAVQVIFCIIVFGMATVAYIAFGSITEDIILLNLPNYETLSIVAKILYLLCIIGSNMIVY
jgi:hypothetical protein